MSHKPLVLLVLIALLLAATSAAADTPAPSTAPPASEEVAFEAEEEGDGGEEESAEEECEEAGKELEEGEISQEELEEACERQRQRSRPGPGGILPEECVVRTFSSNAVATSHNRLDLTIHYTTFEPTQVKIDYGLGTARRHLGAQGVIHLDKYLGAAQAEKLHKLTVQISVPTAPSRCERYYSTPTKVHRR